MEGWCMSFKGAIACWNIQVNHGAVEAINQKAKVIFLSHFQKSKNQLVLFAEDKQRKKVGFGCLSTDVWYQSRYHKVTAISASLYATERKTIMGRGTHPDEKEII